MADLIKGPHPKVTATAAVAALKTAMAADSRLPADLLTNTTYWIQCQKGDRAFGGDQNENRVLGCGNLLFALMRQYQGSRVQADYDAAVAVYGYGYNALSNVNGRDYWSEWIPQYLGLLG